MPRKFINDDTQRVYEQFLRKRPTSRRSEFGQAFFFGYEKPESTPSVSICGLPGSPNRAAWAAGVDTRRAGLKASQSLKSRSPIAISLSTSKVLFRDHAGLYLRVMPQLRSMTESAAYHTKIMILNRLVPKFGDMTLESISDAVVREYKRELERGPGAGGRKRLSASTIKQIIGRLVNILKTTEQELESEPPSHGAQLQLTGQQKLDQVWKESFQKFVPLWKGRPSDAIGSRYSGSLQVWVHRQRELASQGTLETWKRVCLDAIGFKYESEFRKKIPHDIEFAKHLHSFYLEHGHYAPTNQKGVSALYLWVGRMRASNGTSGTLNSTIESAQQAMDYLKANIPEFVLENTLKSRLNQEIGLTRCGRVPALPKSSQILSV